MFTVGQEYARRDIHKRFGGQTQGGISTPANHPLVLIFTGEQGKQYGYEDGWTENGVFLYTGEGQVGDMEFVRGNKAIRDHVEDGKELHLFKYIGRGRVRYQGQMVFAGFEHRRGPDLTGNQRRIIVFHLLPIDAFGVESDVQERIINEIRSLSLEQLRRRAIDQSLESRSQRESKRNVHFRSAAVREYVLRRANGRCEACGSKAPFQTMEGRPYLEPHHIRRLSDGGPDHPDFVAGLCPNCHRRAHYAKDKDRFNKKLGDMIRRKEQNRWPNT